MLIVGWMCAAVPLSMADEPTTASAPAAAEITAADRAMDDATQQLFDAILAVPVQRGNARRSLATLLAGSSQAELEFRGAVWQMRQVGRPRQVAPGTVAVDVWTPADQLQALIRKTVEQLPGGKPGTAIEVAATSLSATGQFADDGQHRDSRPGWRQCTPEVIIMALKAAEADWRERVLSLLVTVPLSNGQPVLHVMRDRPAFERALRARVGRLTCGEAQYQPSGVCVVNGSISPEQLAAVVREAIRDAGLATQSEMSPVVGSGGPVVVQGFAVPPPRLSTSSQPVRSGPAPSWAAEVLSKTASAQAPADRQDAAARNALAGKAACIEARRQLWLAIEALSLPDGQTVGAALAARADRDRLIETIDAAIFTMSTPAVTAEGTVSATLGIRLESVWRALL